VAPLLFSETGAIPTTRKPIGKEPLIAALPHRHPLRKRREAVKLRELIRETLILDYRTPRPSYADLVLGYFHERGLTPAAFFEVRGLWQELPEAQLSVQIEAEVLELLVQFGSGSRRRWILMPRGRRPSTAALTSCGERNASESVRLICRVVHRSRFANCSASVIEPVMISSSQRRPRAIAFTRRARRSARSGLKLSRDFPCSHDPRQCCGDGDRTSTFKQRLGPLRRNLEPVALQSQPSGLGELLRSMQTANWIVASGVIHTVVSDDQVPV
jgi:hypothetical protein